MLSYYFIVLIAFFLLLPVNFIAYSDLLAIVDQDDDSIKRALDSLYILLGINSAIFVFLLAAVILERKSKSKYTTLLKEDISKELSTKLKTSAESLNDWLFSTTIFCLVLALGLIITAALAVGYYKNNQTASANTAIYVGFGVTCFLTVLLIVALVLGWYYNSDFRKAQIAFAAAKAKELESVGNVSVTGAVFEGTKVVPSAPPLSVSGELLPGSNVPAAANVPKITQVIVSKPLNVAPSG